MLGLNDKQGHYGWLRNPAAVESVMSTLPKPMLGADGHGDELMRSLDETKEMLLYEPFRKIVGKDAPKGPQGIGDCVSWGWGNFDNYLQIAQMLDTLAKSNPLLAQSIVFQLQEEWNSETQDALDALVRGEVPNVQSTESTQEGSEGSTEGLVGFGGLEYQECATESIYALSRVEVGQQHGSMQDGSVGAWAAKSATDFGNMSRKALEIAGLSPVYDPQRAKKWGASGLPDSLEPIAKKHTCKVVSMVKTFKEAAASIQNLQPVAICSDQGFVMTRDNQGFCKPQGTWYHCMLLMALRWDRPGCLISQSWGANTPTGPVYKDQPDNTFWADASVIDRILSQSDSFTGNTLANYTKRDYVDWSH